MVLIICLSVGGLISTDIFLPALDKMSDFYQVDGGKIQSTIAIFLLGLSFSQLIYGPQSDSLGRKKTLVAEIVIWLLSTCGVLYSSTIDELLMLRLLQEIGSCAGITISRVIINDIMDKREAGQLYLVIFPFVGMSPAIAPMAGGILSQYFCWRACFVFLIMFIFFTLILCLTSLPETLPVEKRQKLTVGTLWRNTLSFLFNKAFMYYAVIPCFAYAACFAYIVKSPFMPGKLGLASSYIGYNYIFLSLTYVAGNLTAKISAAVWGDITIRKGYFIFVSGAILFVLQMYISPYPLITSIAAISLLTFGTGFLLLTENHVLWAWSSTGFGSALLSWI